MDRNLSSVIGTMARSAVATREGGVDRNNPKGCRAYSAAKSPPARVAWIETDLDGMLKSIICVATREGGVDRNSVFVYEN